MSSNGVGFISGPQESLRNLGTVSALAGLDDLGSSCVNATVASQVTTREDNDSLSRNSIGLNALRSFGNRWFTTAWSQIQQNQELSLDLRAVAGAGFGRDLVHTTRRLWSAYTGLAFTHEQFSGEPSEQSPEVAVGGQLDFFTPGNEDFRITNSLLSYFNVGGRANPPRTAKCLAPGIPAGPQDQQLWPQLHPGLEVLAKSVIWLQKPREIPGRDGRIMTTLPAR